MIDETTNSLSSILENHLNIKDLRPEVIGVIEECKGNTIVASGLKLSLNCICVATIDSKEIELIVTGFSGDKIYLTPMEPGFNPSPGTKIHYRHKSLSISFSQDIIGRVVNSLMKPLDEKEELQPLITYPISELSGSAIANKAKIEKVLPLGIRAVDGFTTIGAGQRIGLFAGSGVGKTVLMGEIAKNTQADLIICALIGERGREVVEFVNDNLGDEGLKRSIVIAEPSDSPAILRVTAAHSAILVAKYWQEQGKNVLLLFDSLTRYAQAIRECALAMGEFPLAKGYPPSVFTKLGNIVEQLGVNKNGSITGIFTVLTEGDDLNDPVADHTRSILDGHIVLDRKLAEKGHYPAIDIRSSISRLMQKIADQEHLKKARELMELYATYYENIDLLNIGAYVKGNNKKLDLAISKIDEINDFLKQDLGVKVDFKSVIYHLNKISS